MTERKEALAIESWPKTQRRCSCVCVRIKGATASTCRMAKWVISWVATMTKSNCDEWRCRVKRCQATPQPRRATCMTNRWQLPQWLPRPWLPLSQSKLVAQPSQIVELANGAGSCIYQTYAKKLISVCVCVCVRPAADSRRLPVSNELLTKSSRRRIHAHAWILKENRRSRAHLPSHTYIPTHTPCVCLRETACHSIFMCVEWKNDISCSSIWLASS